MDGLQPWAKTELKRRGVQDLADAIAVAESLIDYTSRKESTPKPKDKRSGQAKGGGDKGQRKEAHQVDNPPKYKESSTWKGKAKAKDFRGSKKPSSNKCFICDGDHWVRECPQRQALNSLLAQHQEGDGDKSKEGAHMGSLQLLNVIQSAPKTEAKGLIYVDVTINEKTTRAMLDTGESNPYAIRQHHVHHGWAPSLCGANNKGHQARGQGALSTSVQEGLQEEREKLSSPP
ncbi:hypothetical protein V6N13_001851 [Hibiscus sabdariffa]